MWSQMTNYLTGQSNWWSNYMTGPTWKLSKLNWGYNPTYDWCLLQIWSTAFSNIWKYINKVSKTSTISLTYLEILGTKALLLGIQSKCASLVLCCVSSKIKMSTNKQKTRTIRKLSGPNWPISDKQITVVVSSELFQAQTLNPTQTLVTGLRWLCSSNPANPFIHPSTRTNMKQRTKFVELDRKDLIEWQK